MAKRKKRTHKPQANSKTSNGDNNQSTEESTPKRSDSAEQFQQEYAYVLKDLRQIIALAVIMFIFLIVLNLILQQV